MRTSVTTDLQNDGGAEMGSDGGAELRKGVAVEGRSLPPRGAQEMSSGNARLSMIMLEEMSSQSTRLTMCMEEERSPQAEYAPLTLLARSLQPGADIIGKGKPKGGGPEEQEQACLDPNLVEANT